MKTKSKLNKQVARLFDYYLFLASFIFVTFCKLF